MTRSDSASSRQSTGARVLLAVVVLTVVGGGVIALGDLEIFPIPIVLGIGAVCLYLLGCVAAGMVAAVEAEPGVASRLYAGLKGFARWLFVWLP